MSACSIKINGDSYYIACDKVDDLVVIDNYLVNTSSSTIYLYSSILDYNSNTSGYPRIQCSSMTKAVKRDSYNSSYSTVSVSSFEVVNRKTDLSFLLMILILGVLICRLLKR